jgi:hypothetical protein
MTDAERSEFERAQAAGFRPLVRGAFWCAAGVLVVAVALYSVFWLPNREEKEPPYPVPILPETPTAQPGSSPGYEWVDQKAGVVRIPIDDAMTITAGQLPVRKQLK